MNWTPGPARCRSDEYEAEIAWTDMDKDGWPLFGRIRRRGGAWQFAAWNTSGKIQSDSISDEDLMPPTITREALADECVNIYVRADRRNSEDWKAVVAHVIDAVKSGRVE